MKRRTDKATATHRANADLRHRAIVAFARCVKHLEPELSKVRAARAIYREHYKILSPHRIKKILDAHYTREEWAALGEPLTREQAAAMWHEQGEARILMGEPGISRG